MYDAAGIFQFMSAVSEVARGSTTPSVPPVWERHILSGCDNSRSVSFMHPHEYDVISSSDTTVQRSFFFSAADISALRRSLPPHLQNCSKFDMVAAYAWRCRTISISCKPDEETKFVCAMDIRKRIKPPLPVGYYGNLELVRKAKSEATELSVTDVMEMIDQPLTMTSGMIYVVSNLTRLGFEKLEFGWGKAVYGGVAKSIGDWIPQQPSWYYSYKNKMGKEEGIMVPVSLPFNAMEDFVKHLQIFITIARPATSLFITSPL
ncbi:hypothetical protein C2S52_018559 [Perilla frutescens var. hirtella]|nr:hypothetical protein C2S52_018559 [Perilla frutescens var. hirtella]